MLTVDGNPEWGPTAVEVCDREDTSVTAEGLNRLLEKFSPLLPGYEARPAIITYFAGVRAATYTEDFHIAPSNYLQGSFTWPESNPRVLLQPRPSLSWS